MKKRTIVILCIVAVVLVLVPAGIAVNFLLMPSSKELIYLYKASSNEENTLNGIHAEMKQQQLPACQNQEGLIVSAYGYSFVLSGHQSVADKSIDKEVSTAIVVDDKNMIVIFNPDLDNPASFSIKELIENNNDEKAAIEYYLGHPLASEYDCLLAAGEASISSLYLFNNKKNDGLQHLLHYKSLLALEETDSLIKFENGLYKGFIMSHESTDRPLTRVHLFRSNDLDRCYIIVFMGFPLNEVEPIISSIKFDDEAN